VRAGKRGEDFLKWGHTRFVLPEFDRLSKCAWFDYQREKVVVRKEGREPANSLRNKRRKQPKPTKRIEVRSNRCPGCKGRNVCKTRKARRSKLFLDLKMTAPSRLVGGRARCRPHPSGRARRERDGADHRSRPCLGGCRTCPARLHSAGGQHEPGEQREGQHGSQQADVPAL
jgi:hypothetical protein